jgi:hypothetical protein
MSTETTAAGKAPSDDDLVRRGDVFAAVQWALDQESDNLRSALHVLITDIAASPIAAIITEEDSELLDKILRIGDLVGVPRPPEHISPIVMGPRGPQL